MKKPIDNAQRNAVELLIINILVDLNTRVTVQGYTATDGVISISVFEWDDEIFGFAPLDL